MSPYLPMKNNDHDLKYIKLIKNLYLIFKRCSKVNVLKWVYKPKSEHVLGDALWCTLAKVTVLPFRENRYLGITGLLCIKPGFLQIYNL